MGEQKTLAEVEGWGWPLRSRKAHYFVKSRSLCGRWMYTGELTRNQAAGSPDDCKACARKLEKREAAAAPPQEEQGDDDE